MYKSPFLTCPLILSLSCWYWLCLGLVCTGSEPEATLPASVQPASGGFLLIGEWVVLDSLSQAPLCLRERTRFSGAEFLAALQSTPGASIAELSDDVISGEFIRIAAQRWLLVRHHETLVRRNAISLIDDRIGGGTLMPPTPAPMANHHQGTIQALPQAEGLSMAVGSARVFCGVRSAARSVEVTPSDIHLLAVMVHIPTSSLLLEMVIRP